jgi:hypothetical protein
MMERMPVGLVEYKHAAYTEDGGNNDLIYIIIFCSEVRVRKNTFTLLNAATIAFALLISLSKPKLSSTFLFAAQKLSDANVIRMRK